MSTEGEVVVRVNRTIRCVMRALRVTGVKGSVKQRQSVRVCVFDSEKIATKVVDVCVRVRAVG